MIPLTVTGDKAKLMTLQCAVKNLKTYLEKLRVKCPESYNDSVEWLSVIDQAIKDQEFEQSINPLPFK